MYNDLVKQCRDCIDCLCGECKYENLQKPGNFVPCMNALLGESADAIEELLKVASAMHTWIFLHTGDEQAAYDECGLTDEMNAELGYGGQFVVETPKEEA